MLSNMLKIAKRNQQNIKKEKPKSFLKTLTRKQIKDIQREIYQRKIKFKPFHVAAYHLCNFE